MVDQLKGLAPRSTNFMFSMKPNHIFKGKPFVDNKTSFDYECLKNENEQNFSNIIKQLNSEIQKVNNTLSLTLTDEIKTEVKTTEDLRELIEDVDENYVITQVSQQQNGLLVTTTKSESTADTKNKFADRLFQFIMILINGFFISKKQILMNIECSKQLGQKILDMNPECPTSSGGMIDYYVDLTMDPLECFLGCKNLNDQIKNNNFCSYDVLKVGDIVFNWKKINTESSKIVQAFAGILMYMQCSVYYHVGIVVEVPDNKWDGWAAGENPFTSKSAKSHTKIKVVWNATIGEDSMTNIGKDYGGAILVR